MLTGRKKRSLVRFLNQHFPDAEEHYRLGRDNKGRYEWRYECPFCKGGPSRERSFDMNVDGGVGRCWRQSCGWRGSHVTFVAEFLGIAYDKAKQMMDSGEKITASTIKNELRTMDVIISDKYNVEDIDNEDRIFVEIESAVPLEDSRIKDRVYEWISTVRGYDPEKFLKQHDVWVPPQFNAWENRVLFNVYTNDSVAYIMYSMDPKSELKTINPHGAVLSKMLYNYNNVKKAKTVFVTEGIFDCARLMYNGYKAVANFGVALQPAQALLIDELPAKEICVFYDADTEDNSLRALELLDSVCQGKRLSVIQMDIKADPDDISEEKFMELFKKRKFLKSSVKKKKKTIKDIDVSNWY